MCGLFPRAMGALTAAMLLVAVAACKPLRAAEPVLTEGDKEFLENLFELGVPDPPQGAVYVRFSISIWDVWTNQGEAELEGWLVPADDDQEPIVLLPWGGKLAAPEKHEIVDFVDLSTQAASAKPAEEEPEPEPDEHPRRLPRGPRSPYDHPPTLAYAAWAYRLGKVELAAKLLHAARQGGDNEDSLSAFRLDPWLVYSNAVHAYMVRADHAALAYLQQYFNFAAGDEEHDAAAQALLDELLRRQEKGTFAKEPDPPPDDFSDWPDEKRVAYLIDALEEVDARQWGQPGGVYLGGDDRAAALIKCGEVAVPALIECIESDARLTRSVHFWRDFSEDRTILGVREAALVAAMSILRVQVFEPRSTGDNFTRRGPAEAKRVAEELRTYWRKHAKVPFEQRMMDVLTNAESSQEAMREAAVNIATLGHERVLGTTIDASRWLTTRRVPNPAIAMFDNPTAAEAILAAMERDLARHDRERPDPRRGMHEFLRKEIEDTYMWALAVLGDEHIVDKLVARIERTERLRVRLSLALTCARLGESATLDEFAGQFRQGILDPGGDFNQLVRVLAVAGSSACDEALVSMADPSHAFHEKAADAIRNVRPYDDEQPWLSHPFCLRFFRMWLDDMEPSGETYSVADGMLTVESERGHSRGPLPPELESVPLPESPVEARRADATAARVNDLAVGLPYCNPLLADTDERLDKMRSQLDLHMDRMRTVTSAEAQALHLGRALFGSAMFVPDIVPLDHPATPADVAAGRAVFHLDGRGTLTDIELPASAVFATDKQAHAKWVADTGEEDRWGPPRVLVVQAEKAADGTVYCGIIERFAIRRVRADELVDFAPLAVQDEQGE